MDERRGGSTAHGRSSATPRSTRPCARRVARACTRGRSGRWFEMACEAARASEPDWRTPPPKSLRNHLALSIRAREPTRTLPMGAPRPLERHSDTEWKGAHASSSGMPVLAATSHRRAPSQCSGIACRSSAERRRTSSGCGKITVRGRVRGCQSDHLESERESSPTSTHFR